MKWNIGMGSGKQEMDNGTWEMGDARDLPGGMEIGNGK